MGEARRKAQAVQPRPGETPEQWDERVDKLLAACDADHDRVKALRAMRGNPIVQVFNTSAQRSVERQAKEFASLFNRAIPRAPVTK